MKNSSMNLSKNGIGENITIKWFINLKYKEEIMSEKEMSRKDIGMLGFENVAYSGDARSSLLEALKDARNGKFDGLEEKFKRRKKILT